MSINLRTWWRVRRVLLFPAVNAPLSSLLAIVGFLLSLVSFAFAAATVLGWCLGIIGLVAAAAYFMDNAVRRIVMRHVAYTDKDLRAHDFALAPVALDPEYRLVSPADASDEQLYPYTDLSHHSSAIRAATDLSRAARTKLYARWYQCCPEGFLHLEKLVDSEWRPISVSIVFPLSLESFASATNGDPERQARVIDFDRRDILTAFDKRRRILLIDTWIVDRKFKSAGHGKTPTSGGFANALVLKNIARFWNSKNNFPETTFLVETNNRYLVSALLELAFRPGGQSKINASFYELEKSTLAGLAPDEFKQILRVLRDLEAVSVHTGTAPLPSDWATRFPGYP
jgi:hypothetical protein